MMKKKTRKERIKKEKRLAKKEINKNWSDARKNVKIIQQNKCYLCSKIVFGKSAHIHHIIDRRVKELFCDLKNLVLLCPRCHKLGPFAVHNSSIYFSEILKQREPERYEYLVDYMKSVKFVFK